MAIITIAFAFSVVVVIIAASYFGAVQSLVVLDYYKSMDNYLYTLS